MARDRKLREVLDTLSGDPARSLPSQDRELMESVLRRLKIQESHRSVPLQEPPQEEPSPLDAAREEALRNEQALQELRARQEHDSEEMQRLQEERERLLAHQSELEERLARLEAASHGGPLSYVEENPEPEVVEFSRVDLNNHQNNQDELLEFQHMGSGEESFGRPEAGAWEPDETEPTTDWSESDWPQAPHADEEPTDLDVSWDDEGAGETAWDTAPTKEAPWPASPVEEEPEPEAAQPWQEPGEAAWEPAENEAEETPPWSEPTVEESWADEPDAPPSAPHAHAEGAPAQESPDEGLEDLDDRTRAELEELETQLAQLEREIEKRDQKKQALDEEEDARA